MAKKKAPKIEVFKETRPYILWRRVSTKSQGRSGLGLEAQLVYAQRYMGRDPVAIYTDVCSGTNLMACEMLWKAIKECKDNDYVLVVAKTDRFRNVENSMAVLREIGEGNLIFCDLPECNKFVLQIMWAVWERQADMIQENTRRALEMRTRQAEKEGGWFSKSGRWRKHLGNDKGVDTSAAVAAQARAKADEARNWRENNDGYKWVKKQVLKKRLHKDILAEFNEFHDMGLTGFATREGRPMNPGTLSKWIKEIRRQN